MAKKREKGETYRPVATVVKTKGENITVLMVGGKRYVLDLANK